jgi:hypothetical protein
VPDDYPGLQDEALAQEIALLSDLLVAVSEASAPLSAQEVDGILGVPDRPDGRHTAHRPRAGSA